MIGIRKLDEVALQLNALKAEIIIKIYLDNVLKEIFLQNLMKINSN